MPTAEHAPMELPTFRQSLVFEGKTLLLKAWRLLKDLSSGVRRHRKSKEFATSEILGSSVTSLWSNAHPAEMDLTAGKVQNLREACRALDGVIVPAGEAFSFWKQLGRATKRRGYVSGRELREGCLIPTVGGGLCQISNALYDAALNSGMEIVERHAHSQVIPGSLAEQGRDATVFWNYVDLRFRSDRAFRIEARLSKDDLIVSLKGESSDRGQTKQSIGEDFISVPVGNCFTCEKSGCFRNDHRVAEDVRFGRTAFVVDAFWPEFDQYIFETRNEDDVLLLPLDGKKWGKENYAWEVKSFSNVGFAKRAVAERSIAMRKMPRQGSALQKGLLKFDEKMATALARQIEFDVKHVVVSQNLLPFLWRDGFLGGRTFDVLMTRFPMGELQRRLSEAHEKYPESPTLSDFRADSELVALEEDALRHSARIVTPHAGIADFFEDRAVVELPWSMPDIAKTEAPGGPPVILFAASALARKGFYEFRDAVSDLPVRVMVAGGAVEFENPWEGVETVPFSVDWPTKVSLAVLPAHVEHQPRRILRAIAAGVPALVSSACGLREREGLTVIDEPDADEIRKILRNLPALQQPVAHRS